jgi:hypothetical protein
LKLAGRTPKPENKSLAEAENGMASCMGYAFSMSLEGEVKPKQVLAAKN